MCLAIPGRLVAITGDGDLRSGEVDFGGVSRDANLVFVPEAVVGDYVLVHVGFAIARIDEDVARDTLDALNTLEAMTAGERLAAETSPGGVARQRQHSEAQPGGGEQQPQRSEARLGGEQQPQRSEARLGGEEKDPR